jgi:hypothetical protein
LPAKPTALKLLYFLLAGFFCINAQAQTTLSPGKLSIGLSVEPGSHYRTLTKQTDSSFGGLIYRSRNEREVAKLGYHLALTMRYQLNDILQIESGVQYANKGYRLKRKPLVFFPTDPSLPTYSSFRYSYHYLGIPITLRALFGKQKLQFSTSLGVAANLLLNVKTKTKQEFADGHTDSYSEVSRFDYKKFDLAPMLGIGVHYRMSKKLNGSLEPGFRYSVLPTTNTTIKERLWSVGVNAGLFYNLQ